VISELEGFDLRWICDLEPQLLARFGRRYPSCAQTSDIEHLLNDRELDAIFVATPVVTHFDLAARSLAAGKHTFVEKPLAPSSAQADQLLELADAEDLVLMCGHTFLYSPNVRMVKQLMDRQELGEILFVSSSRVFAPYRSDVNVIWDLGPHDFSILLYWLEEMPRSVRAVGRDSVGSGIFDVAFVTLTYESGLVASIELSWLAPRKERRTVIMGNQRSLVYDDGDGEPVRLFDHGAECTELGTFDNDRLSHRIRDIRSPFIEAEEPLANELEDFAMAIREGSETVASAAMARDVVRLTEAADESLRQGGVECQLAPVERWPAMTQASLGLALE
jgi:predicted dehydrogenase